MSEDRWIAKAREVVKAYREYVGGGGIYPNHYLEHIIALALREEAERKTDE